MQQQEVTNLMDWINDQWGWIVLAIAGATELIRDHLRIKTLETNATKTSKDVESLQRGQNDMKTELAVLVSKIDDINENTKKTLDRVINIESNIIDIYKK